MHLRPAIGVHQLRARAVVELPPPAECLREPRGCARRNAVCERLAVGRPRRRRRRELGIDAVEDAAHATAPSGPSASDRQNVGDVLLHRQSGIGQIEDVRDISLASSCADSASQTA